MASSDNASKVLCFGINGSYIFARPDGQTGWLGLDKHYPTLNKIVEAWKQEKRSKGRITKAVLSPEDRDAFFIRFADGSEYANC